MMSVIDLNAILECNKLRYRTNGFLVCYLILNYCNLISVTEIDLSLVIRHFITKKNLFKRFQSKSKRLQALPNSEVIRGQSSFKSLNKILIDKILQKIHFHIIFFLKTSNFELSFTNSKKCSSLLTQAEVDLSWNRKIFTRSSLIVFCSFLRITPHPFG